MKLMQIGGSWLNRMKPFLVVGTRPEIVKMAPIFHECEKRGIDYYLLHTGQHYTESMSESFFVDMGLRDPDKNLNIGSGTHSEQTAKALVGIEKELVTETPSFVAVEGDTNAVLSAALAAVKLHIPLAHVEAGLRSYDKRMPEEYNRRLTDHASDYLFAPTERSADTLRHENVMGEIFVTGNTVIDALEMLLPVARKRKAAVHGLKADGFALMTLHRAENVDDRATLEGLVRGLLSLDTKIVFPAHPRTVARLNEFGLMSLLRGTGFIEVTEPLGYLDFLRLMDMCFYVITDSGGIQEEVTAPSLNKRVFVLRVSTERPEAVESGHATVVGVDPVVFPKMIKDSVASGLHSTRPCPYGSGDAAKRIMDVMVDKF
jgi:UDP-N-acetylglucosamine 2-epimerase (non-hydrolysing)